MHNCLLTFSKNKCCIAYSIRTGSLKMFLYISCKIIHLSRVGFYLEYILSSSKQKDHFSTLQKQQQLIMASSTLTLQEIAFKGRPSTSRKSCE